MKKVGVNIPEDMKTVLSTIEAVRIASCVFPETLVFTAFVDSVDIGEILRASGQFTEIWPLDRMDENKYHLIHYVDPTVEVAEEYGEDEKNRRIADAKKHMLGEEVPNFSAVPFNLLQTVCRDLQEDLKLLNEKFEPQLDLQGVKPYVHINKKTRDYIRFLMRKNYRVGKEFIKDNLYLVVEGAEEVDSVCYNVHTFYVRLTDNFTTYVDEEMTLLQQAALVDNENCIGYIGSGWLSYVAWAKNKPVIIELASSNPEDDNYVNPMWDGIRQKRALYYDVSTRDLSDLTKNLEPLIDGLVMGE